MNSQLSPALLALLLACDPSKIDFPSDEDDCDPEVWYTDADGDGFGDASDPTTGCEAPEGAVSDGTDCDDTDADVNPDAEERCNALDDDCDRAVDEGAGDASWYTDADGDGVGDSATRESGCEAPADSVSIGGDCDDHDPGVTVCPYAGTLDLAAESDAMLVGESKLNFAGTQVAHAGDLNGDGFGDLMTSSNEAYTDRGGLYIVYGPVSTERNLSTAEAIIRGGPDGPDTGMLLRNLTVGGDLTGDGLTDFTSVDDLFNGDGVHRGRIWIMEAQVTGLTDLSTAPATITGHTDDWLLGSEIARLDLDGDGALDLATSVSGGPFDASNPGRLEVFWGPLSGDLDTPDQVIRGEAGGDAAGSGLAAEDLNGDGLPDLVIGARASAGAVFVVYGPNSDSLLDLSAADAAIYASDAGSHFGEEVSSAGDLDGDGYADLAALAPYAPTGGGGEALGRAYVLSGPLSGAASLSVATAILQAPSVSTGFHGASTTAADLDVDGRSDLVLVSPVSNAYAGSVYLHYGPLAGTLDLDDGDADAIFVGDNITAYATAAADAGGDIDADGVPDLLIGTNASVGETAADTQAGRVHLLYGGIR